MIVRLFSLLIIVLIAAGCASTGSDPDVSVPLEGADAAVVKIFIDSKTGEPRVSENTVKVKRGQRIVWAGPNDFTIAFPQGGPFAQKQYSTEDAVINLLVPEKQQNQKSSAEPTSRYKYDVIANGKVLDPHIVIIEQ